MQHLIVECGVRTVLIALATAATLRLLNVKSAGARHAAWAGVLALMLVLPAWMTWGPRASLRVLPARPAATANAIPLVLPAPLGSSEFHAAAVPPAAPPMHWNWLLIAYLSGALLLLARLAIGTLHARSLVRHATLRDGRLTSARCAAPVTVGWLRPTVVLPEAWRSWPAEQLDAVLTHEGAHVRRRDPLVQWLAMLNRAIFWFHPLAWWLEQRLSALAEEACDTAVLERGHDARAYSGYLLQLARAVSQSGGRIHAIGMAMPGSSLPLRIRLILTRGGSPRVTRGRAIGLTLALLTVSAILAAATVDRQQDYQDPPQPPVPPAAPAAPAAPVARPTPPRPPAPPALFRDEQPPVPPAPPAAWSSDFDAPTPPAPPPPPAAWSSDFDAPTPPAPPRPPAAWDLTDFPTPPARPQARSSWSDFPNSQASKPLLAFYFDFAGMSKQQQADAIAFATRYLETQTESGDRAAVLIRSEGLVKVVHDFTADHETLLRDIRNVSAGSEAFDSQKQLSGLRTAADMLGYLGDRKAVIYFAGDSRQTASEDQLRNVIETAQRANVAFYRIDVSNQKAGK